MLTESKTPANRNFLEERLDVDLAWCMAANLNDDEIQTPPFGSWTVFNSMVTNKRTIKSYLDFLPVIPHPQNDSILKDYLDFLIDVKADLEIDNIFGHSDQDVFYKISQIMWKEKKYDGIINIWVVSIFFW